MKRILALAAALALCATMIGRAQSQSTGSSGTAQKSVASTMNVYVFPNAGQSPSQQSQDEGACYQWAVQNTGTDPFQLAKQAEAQKQQAQQQAAASQGSGARGAARGAAAGALVGGMAGDAGKGAAVGATAGAVSGRRRGKQAQAQADQQTAQVQASATQQMDNFKKAFGGCLESKKYMVK